MRAQYLNYCDIVSQGGGDADVIANDAFGTLGNI